MSHKEKGMIPPMKVVISGYLSKHGKGRKKISLSRINFREGAPYNHKNSNALFNP
jgi:hypothetical protein